MSEYATFEDEILLRLIAIKKTDALGALYDRYGRLAYSIAYQAVGDRETAEEITQDVFLRVWNSAHAYRADRGKVITWIASIARHRAIDILRRRKIRPESKSVYWDDLLTPHIPQQNALEEDIEQLHHRGEVQKAVADLPEEQRSALALAFFGGYTHKEIAEIQKLPLGTVKTRIRLGMQKLRLTISEDISTGQ